jgi:hypothetical protein
MQSACQRGQGGAPVGGQGLTHSRCSSPRPGRPPPLEATILSWHDGDTRPPRVRQGPGRDRVRAMTNGCPVQSSSAPGPSRDPARESAVRAARRGSRPLPRPRCLLVKDRNLLTKLDAGVDSSTRNAPWRPPGRSTSGQKSESEVPGGDAHVAPRFLFRDGRCRHHTQPCRIRQRPQEHPGVQGGASAGHGLPIVLAEHRARSRNRTARRIPVCQLERRTRLVFGRTTPPPQSDGDGPEPVPARHPARQSRRRTRGHLKPGAPGTGLCSADQPPCSSPDSAKDRRTSGTVCTSNVTKTRPARRAAGGGPPDERCARPAGSPPTRTPAPAREAGASAARR